MNGGAVYHDEIQFEARLGRARAVPLGGGYMPYGGYQGDAKVVNKPLADVSFDAYDLSGKRVPRSEALKRLAAGGMVLVAGDSRMPDDTYLRGFRDDVLVLVSNELVLPIPPLDQTKKKQEAVKQIRIFRD